MPHTTELIAILCIGFVLAFALGMLAQRLKLSPLVGYLVAGILAGPFTPGFVGDPALASQLAEVGVILLLFGVGLHFSLKDLLAVRAIAVPGALAQTFVATCLGWGVSRLLGWTTLEGVIFGFSLATASTVVLLRAMEERRLLESRRGRIAVGWLIVEDLICVVALVLMPIVGGLAAANGATVSLGAAAVEIGKTLAQVALFVAVMLVVGRRVIPWLLERTAGTGSRELFTLGVLAIALGVAFAAAELFGVSFALGAFFAGMVLNESELSHKAAEDSLPMRDAFAVLFFVSVGMLFDPMSLVREPWLVLATVLIIMLGKSLAAYAIVRAFGHPTLRALTISASLAQIGEFAFIIAALGVSLKILPQQGLDLVLAGALISIMLNPLAFKLVDRWQARHATPTDEREPAAAAPASRVADAAAHHVPDDVAGHVIVVGYGRVGQQLTTLLRQRGIPVVVVETDIDRVEQARHAGLPAVWGNVAAEAVLAEARPERAKLVAFAIPQALEAGEAIGRLRAVYADLVLLARAHSDTELRHLMARGADGGVLAERELAFALAAMVTAAPPFRAAAPAPAAA